MIWPLDHPRSPGSPEVDGCTGVASLQRVVSGSMNFISGWACRWMAAAGWWRDVRLQVPLPVVLRGVAGALGNRQERHVVGALPR